MGPHYMLVGQGLPTDMRCIPMCWGNGRRVQVVA